MELRERWRVGDIGIESDRREIGLREIGSVGDIVSERLGDIGIVRERGRVGGIGIERDRRDIGIEREGEWGILGL